MPLIVEDKSFMYNHKIFFFLYADVELICCFVLQSVEQAIYQV